MRNVRATFFPSSKSEYSVKENIPHTIPTLLFSYHKHSSLSLSHKHTVHHKPSILNIHSHSIARPSSNMGGRYRRTQCKEPVCESQWWHSWRKRLRECSRQCRDPDNLPGTWRWVTYPWLSNSQLHTEAVMTHWNDNINPQRELGNYTRRLCSDAHSTTLLHAGRRKL